MDGVLAGAVAIGAVGGAGAATAGVFSAHTGRGPVDAEDVELGGLGERLDPAAPDFATVLDEVTTDIEFPSSQARDRALSWEVKDLYSDAPPDERATVSTGALFGTARRLMLADERADRQRRLAEDEHARFLEPTAHMSSNDGSVWGPAVREALASLSETDRELIRLTEWEQLQINEAAVVLRIRPGTAPRAAASRTPRLGQSLSASRPAGTAT